MPLDLDRVETITFDSFTTIVDVGTSTRRALSRHLDDPDPVADLWRVRAVDYRMVSTFVDEYETYERTTREALEYALAVHGHDLADEAIDEIAGVFFELDVYDDVRPGMERLAPDYDLYVLSNGNPSLLAAMVERAGIGDLVEDTVSADEIQAYKPDARIYEHGARRSGTDLDRIAHVATPWYDVYGAMGAGMQGIWVNRDGRPWDAFDGEPDLVVDGFDDLVAAFGG